MLLPQPELPVIANSSPGATESDTLVMAKAASPPSRQATESSKIDPRMRGALTKAPAARVLLRSLKTAPVQQWIRLARQATSEALVR